jgi:hypothetical protein
MTKLNQRNYVPLAVAALSAILIASIVAIGGGISATAQNNMTGGNMTTSNLTGTTGGSMGGSEGGDGSMGGSEGGDGGGDGGDGGGGGSMGGG